MSGSIAIKRVGREARHRILPVVGRIGYIGQGVVCPCCGSQFRRFTAHKGPNRMCWKCGSLERHRAVALYLERHPALLTAGASILHVAPEPALRQIFTAVPDVSYVSGDYDGQFGDERIDVTQLQFPDDAFDVVVCNNTLECVPDDRSAMRELRRVLKPGGWALLMVGGLEQDHESTTETIMDLNERRRQLGDIEMVRRYGRDYPQRLAEAGFEPTVIEIEPTFGPEAIARYRLKLDRWPVGAPIVVGR